VRRPKLKRADEDVEVFDTVEQNSPEWDALRCGIPTASKFGAILAGGEGLTREGYMHEIVGEMISGVPNEGFRNRHMERGHAWQEDAIEAYEFAKGVSVRRVGFIRRGLKGCSPDGLVGDDGGVEIKTFEPKLMVKFMLAPRLPTEHLPQVHGNIWISGRRWWDICIYSRRFRPAIFRVLRDEQYIGRLEIAVSSFYEQALEMAERVRTAPIRRLR